MLFCDFNFEYLKRLEVFIGVFKNMLCLFLKFKFFCDFDYVQRLEVFVNLLLNEKFEL